jgi:glycosyltransferase involved in cell wall biosynthesis
MHICAIGLRGIPSVIGGVEAHCEHLYTALVRHAEEATVTVLIRRGYTPYRRLRLPRLYVRTIWSPHIWGVDTLVHSLLSVLYAGIVLRPDIVHLHGIGPGFFTPLARLLGMRTVVTHHAQDYLRPKWKRNAQAFLRSGEKLTAFAAHRIICVSRSLSEEFLRLHPGARPKTRIILNASTLLRLGQPNESRILEERQLTPKRYILAVGRLEATKGFHLLVQAFRRAEVDYKLAIVGSDFGNDPYAVRLRRAASDRIIFPGFLNGDALRKLYEEAALFVHPSRMEGFGLVVAESLAAGIPTILSDIPPHREFGLPDRCYFPVDDCDAIVDKLRHPNFADFSSIEASQLQRANRWTSVATQHLELYRELLGTGRRRSKSGRVNRETTPS